MDWRKKLASLNVLQELELPQEEEVPDVNGEENIFQGELKLNDVVVEKEFEYLRDYLTMVAPAGEIVRIYNEHPDKLGAKRHCGSCKDCDPSDGGDCSKKKDKKA